MIRFVGMSITCSYLFSICRSHTPIAADNKRTFDNKIDRCVRGLAAGVWGVEKL